MARVSALCRERDRLELTYQGLLTRYQDLVETTALDPYRGRRG